MLIDKAYESHLPQARGPHCLVHVACSGIPPRAAAIVGRGGGASRRQTPLDKFLEAGAWPSPLPPYNGAQFPSNPPIQHFEICLDFTQPKVGYPATQHDAQFLTDTSQITTSSASEQNPKFGFESLDRLWGHLQLRLPVPGHTVAQKLSLSGSIHSALVSVDPQTQTLP